MRSSVAALSVWTAIPCESDEVRSSDASWFSHGWSFSPFASISTN
jgi:hypothetical protein